MSSTKQRLQKIEKQVKAEDNHWFFVNGLRDLYFDFKPDPPCYREYIDGKPGRIVTEEEIKREEAEALAEEREKRGSRGKPIFMRIIIDDSPLRERDD